MWVALGSNVASDRGPPPALIAQALDALADSGLPVLRRSRIYATPAHPAGSGPDFANAVAEIAAGGRPPGEVLALLHRIEAGFGRAREERWGPRTLDLDLIAAGAAVLPDRATWAEWHDLPAADQARRAPDRLILPHPRLQDRLFVLVPLAGIAPGWRHPVTGQGVAEMIAAFPAAERAAIRPLGDAAEFALVKPVRGA